MVDAAATPDIQSKAAAHIDAIVDTALGRDAQVSVNRGATIRNWKEGASEDVVEIVVKDAKFKNAPAKVIEAEAKKVTDAMHEERDIRRQAVLLSPKDYLEYGKKEIKELQTLAKVSGTPMANVDFSTASILNADFYRNSNPMNN